MWKSWPHLFGLISAANNQVCSPGTHTFPDLPLLWWLKFEQVRLRVKECITSMRVLPSIECVCVCTYAWTASQKQQTYCICANDSFWKEQNWQIFGWAIWMCLRCVCFCLCVLFLCAKFTLTFALYRDWREFNACCGLLVVPQNIFLLLVPVKTNEQNTWFFYFLFIGQKRKTAVEVSSLSWLASWEVDFQESQLFLKPWSREVCRGGVYVILISRKEIGGYLVYFCPAQDVLEGFYVS